jgi:hypothetical protein
MRDGRKGTGRMERGRKKEGKEQRRDGGKGRNVWW